MSKERNSNSVEIRPQVTVLSVLRYLNYKPWFAIAEFIDNSIQSFIENESLLRKIHGKDYSFNINIKIDTTPPGRIVIKDNAAGIAGKDFHRAFRTAQVPENRSGLSEFGMGIKVPHVGFLKNGL
ncbi:TPA: ATP-binding protein [Kluyvera ascorbata F0526]|nr:ATP-binding protein [Kluyvera ascorbata F0526]